MPNMYFVSQNWKRSVDEEVFDTIRFTGLAKTPIDLQSCSEEPSLRLTSLTREDSTERCLAYPSRPKRRHLLVCGHPEETPLFERSTPGHVFRFLGSKRWGRCKCSPTRQQRPP